MKATIIIDDKAIKDGLDEITTKLQEIQRIAGTLGWNNNIKVVFTSEQEKEPPVKADGVEELASKVLKKITDGVAEQLEHAHTHQEPPK